MSSTDLGEWMMWGHAAASITFNDPVWAAQSYEMDRGERKRNNYDPPLPRHFVDALRERQRRLNVLDDRMVAEGRNDDPPESERDTWACPQIPPFNLHRPVAGGIRWVPASLMVEYRSLREVPLPTSADAHREIAFGSQSYTG